MRNPAFSRRTALPTLSALSLLTASSFAGMPTAARADAGMHTLRLEGGIAIPVTTPQTSRFDLGGGLALAYELRPLAWLGVEARLSGFWFPSSAAAPTPDGHGSYYAPALGVRAHPLAGLGLGDLWVGAAIAAVFTGDVARPGVDAGLGYEFDVTWWLRAGPFARYHHVFQTDDGGSDAGFVSIGVSISFLGEEPTRDRDGDGLLDQHDGCPTEPEDDDEFEDDDGCPDPDDDADGVPDATDQCRLEPEDRDGWQDEDGCPDPDDDADGIADADDQCRQEAEDRDGWQDEDGCPDPDDDADGIPDAGDQCPREAETRNGHEDEDGCPDEAPPPPRTEAEVQLDRLGERILFPRNRVQVLASSRPVLRSVIELLDAHPEITRVIVEAHASREGDAEHNMELSRRRAQTVIRVLVAGGIDPSRLEARPMGDQHPEATGGTEAEHALNRRVVFVVQRTTP